VGWFPPRYDPKCHYLRDPSGPYGPSKPADLQVHGDISNLLKGPTNANAPDYKKSIPDERDPNPLHGVKPPDGAPSHDSGLSKDGHIIMVPVWGSPQKESPDQTPYQPPR
jgi:hypothetical protein